MGFLILRPWVRFPPRTPDKKAIVLAVAFLDGGVVRHRTHMGSSDKIKARFALILSEWDPFAKQMGISFPAKNAR